MIILDGAYGTNLQKGLTHSELQSQYHLSGADMVSVDYFDINFHDYKLPNISIPDCPCYASVGPSNILLSKNPEHREELTDIYRKIALDASVYTNTFLLETFSDLHNIKAAIDGIVSINSKALIMVSVSPEDTGHLLSGHTIKTVHDAVFLYSNVIAFGVNCIEPKLALKFINELSNYSNLPLLYKPNIGLGREFVEDFYESISQLTSKVNYIGACCGSTPEDIKFISKYSSLPSFTPFKFNLSGRISERFNVNGSKAFRKACEDKDFFQIYKLIDYDAFAIDINLDSLENKCEIYDYIINIPALRNKWISIDSSDKSFFYWAIKRTAQPIIINSLAEEEHDSIKLQVIEFQRLGTLPIVRACLPDINYGTPEQLHGIFDWISKQLRNLGPVLYDICIRTLGMEDHDKLLTTYIALVDSIYKSDNLIPVCGISNASFLYRSNKGFRAAFNEALRQTINIELVIGNNIIPDDTQVLKVKNKIFSPKLLSRMSINSFSCKTPAFSNSISSNLINQQVDALENVPLTELLSALDELCVLYDKMELSLIQLVYAAETINKLFPVQNIEGVPKFAIGTVTGDVHSIGKDINISVIRAMGIGVRDLGIDVPYNNLAVAFKLHPIIGLSALISPSLEVIEKQLIQLDKHFTNDVILGGAAVRNSFVVDLQYKLKNLKLHYSQNPLQTHEIIQQIISRLDTQEV